IRKAVDLLRSEGPAAVVDRLRATREPRATAPGYAASGWVQSAGPGVLDRAPGTAVACAGAGHASHAEWISVPRQLTVPVPEGVGAAGEAGAAGGCRRGVRRGAGGGGRRPGHAAVPQEGRRGDRGRHGTLFRPVVCVRRGARSV